MTNIDTSDEAFTEAIKAVVAANPDHTIDSLGQCVYVLAGKPCCLIGQVLARLGVPIERLAAFDRAQNSSAQWFLPELGFSTRITEAALEAQGSQDAGLPWSHALAEYLQALGEDQ